MSYNENKTVLRVELPQLDGFDCNGALSYFKPLIGEPEDLDAEDEYVEYFYYNNRVIGNFVPFRFLDNDDKWGVDLILAYSSDYRNGEDFEVSLGEIKDKICKMSNIFNVNENDIYLTSYSWYNGGDEPRYIRKQKNN